MATIRTLGGGAKSETMPDSNSAHEPPYCEGPLHEMSLRDIAEAFLKDPDADVVGVIHKLLAIRAIKGTSHILWARCGAEALGLADSIIDHVEGQK